MSIVSLKTKTRPRVGKIEQQDTTNEYLGDHELVTTLTDLKEELRFLYGRFNNATDPALIDCCIYEIKALHMKYKYFLKKCKERQLRVGP